MPKDCAVLTLITKWNGLIHRELASLNAFVSKSTQKKKLNWSNILIKDVGKQAERTVCAGVQTSN